MALAIAISAGSIAQAYEFTPIEAKLVKPLDAPVKKTIDGRVWTCKGDTCTANAEIGRFLPIKAECAGAAKILGAFATYKNGKTTLSDADLAACNAS
ncbi:hypothetical protein BH11PSE2_BH11PSE2_06560 [soil metagenome]